MINFFVSGLFLAAMASQSPSKSEEQVFCTMDVKECSDGSFVARDPSNGCQFKDCPTSPPVSLGACEQNSESDKQENCTTDSKNSN